MRLLGQRPTKLTKREEQHAYDVATERDLGVCQRCGRTGPTDRDHRQNRDPFNTVPANLQLLGSSRAVGGCGCHEWKTRNVADALQQGFTVPSWGTPDEWPAYRAWDGWVIYLNEPDHQGRWWKPLTEKEALAILAELLAE